MIGNPAPDFSLTASNGNLIKLSALRPNFVLLVFYPKNGSPTCNRQLDDLSLCAEEFFRKGVRVFGVNTATVDKQQIYCERRELTFPILSDPGGEVAKSFGAKWAGLPVIRRTVLLVGPDGRMLYYSRGAPSAKSILSLVDEYLSELGGAQ